MKNIGLSLFIILTFTLAGLVVEAKPKSKGYKTASVYMKEKKKSHKKNKRTIASKSHKKHGKKVKPKKKKRTY